MKKEFLVEIPLNGRVTVIVEADNEEQALQEALEKCDLQLKPESELGYELESWDVSDKLLQGNVWYGIIYEANVEENKF